MLKLTYSLPNDRFRTVSVLGDAAGIYDLWFRLTHSNPIERTHGVENIRIHNLDGVEVDPRLKYADFVGFDSPLSNGAL